MANQSARISVPQFRARKQSDEKLVVLTAYDFPTARIFDAAGVDMLLVGDSVGTTVHGRETTLAVTMDQMVYHTELVVRGSQRALVVADLPFLSYQADQAEAIRNAGRFLKEGGAQAVKLEGGERSAATIAAIVAAQIPVMAHVGLTPQSVHAFGGYKVQRASDQLRADARAAADAGAFSIVLEGMPAELAQTITADLPIPTIGIGAGPHCDGQVLVWYDAVGLSGDFHPRYVKRFADLGSILSSAVQQYADEVRAGIFPGPEQSYR